MQRLSAVLVSLVTWTLAGCFAARIPPPLEAVPEVPLPALRVAVRIPGTSSFDDINRSIADSIVEDLRRTGLFSQVGLGADGEASDLVVEYVANKRPDPGDWCYESLAYVGFTLFVLPGCWESYGYRLRVRAADGAVRDFDFEFDEKQVAGWMALLLLPSSEWEMPDVEATAERRSRYLARQLVPILESLGAGSGEGSSK